MTHSLQAVISAFLASFNSNGVLAVKDFVCQRFGSEFRANCRDAFSGTPGLTLL
jgi:hypothetical protein